MGAQQDPGTLCADLILGHYLQLTDRVEADATITDAPFSERTHKGHNSAEKQVRGATGQATRRALSYECFTDEQTFSFGKWCARHTKGWVCIMCDHHQFAIYEQALQESGRYTFAPVWIHSFTPRLCGDGPSSPGLYMIASRPRTALWSNWRTTAASYDNRTRRNAHIGGKEIPMTRSIIRDYSNPGDLVMDPCAGFGTTLFAARQEWRHSIGCEIDPVTFETARARLDAPWTPSMLAPRPKQSALAL